MTEQETITIKKYPNRRLYNTKTSSYITLDDLFKMVKENIDFQVIDAKTGDDLTKNVLTQIIFEQEAKGYSMLPISFLRQVISFYGDHASTILPQYLESAMKTFYDNQDQIRSFVPHNLDPLNPVKMFEEISKQNMKMFEEGMKMLYKNFTRS